MKKPNNNNSLFEGPSADAIANNWIRASYEFDLWYGRLEQAFAQPTVSGYSLQNGIDPKIVVKLINLRRQLAKLMIRLQREMDAAICHRSMATKLKTMIKHTLIFNHWNTKIRNALHEHTHGTCTLHNPSH